MGEIKESLIKDRNKKLKKLRELGKNPYPAKTNRTHRINDCLENFSNLQGKKITIAGRIRLIRGHGRATFMQIADQSSKIQLYFREDDLQKENYRELKYYDIGDIIEVGGKLFTTKTQEKTLRISDFRILCKSLIPLPEKWHGIKDKEVRYRKRYLDLLMNEEAREVFKKRSVIIETIRQFLLADGFLEVETPVLQPIYGGGLAKPFVTHHNELDLDMYLRISTELYLKRLIVGGFEKVFEFGRIFRNEGVDLFHNPEFTIMETMSAYYDYQDNMKLTENLFDYVVGKVQKGKLVEYQGKKINMQPPYQKIKLIDAVKQYTSFDYNKIKSLEEARRQAWQLDVDVEGIESIGGIATKIFEKKVEEKLIEPTLVYDYPVESSPLAKRSAKDPRFVERFEMFIVGKEFSNNYSELNDPEDLTKRFIEERKKLELGDGEAHQTDFDFLEAIQYGMPPTSGLGIGIDRLVMLLTNQASIRDVVLFPTMRPIEKEIGEEGRVIKDEEPMPVSENIKEAGITRAEALKLVDQYVKNENYQKHLLASEAVMRELAKKLRKNQDVWGVAGLLHDLDWEETEKTPSQHGLTTAEILAKKKIDSRLIHSIIAHNYHYTKINRVTDIDYALCASELITGLIVAATLVTPDKQLAKVKPSSVRKKFKDKSFAAKIPRQDIKDIERIGIKLDEFISLALGAMQKISSQLGL